MPRKRRHQPHQRAPSSSAEVLHFLRTGEHALDWSLGWGGSPRAIDDVWNDVRDELLPEWIDETPGRRPFVWWLLDAPRGGHSSSFLPDVLAPGAGIVARAWTWPLGRKVLGGSGRADGPIECFGLPDRWAGLDFAHAPVVESEASFLRRHRLLEDGEAARLRAADFRPVRLSEDLFSLDGTRAAWRLWPTWSHDVFGDFEALVAQRPGAAEIAR